MSTRYHLREAVATLINEGRTIKQDPERTPTPPEGFTLVYNVEISRNSSNRLVGQFTTSDHELGYAEVHLLDVLDVAMRR